MFCLYILLVNGYSFNYTSIQCPFLQAHTHNYFMGLWTLSGSTWVRQYQKVHFAIIWIFWCKMKITQADAPTIWMDCHPMQTNWCPHLCHPHHCYAGCPSWHNLPNLSWLGTATKYAGLHTQWLDLPISWGNKAQMFSFRRLCLTAQLINQNPGEIVVVWLC